MQERNVEHVLNEISMNNISAQKTTALLAVEKRLVKLKEIATEENYEISPASEKALKDFLAATSFTKCPYITLLDNGNFRAFWTCKSFNEQVGLQFFGNNIVQFVIFARQQEVDRKITRTVGRDLIININGRIVDNKLQYLLIGENK